ncbi:MAG: LVIVD repeat-containing protein [Candidatus Acidiferrales bacterium]
MSHSGGVVSTWVKVLSLGWALGGFLATFAAAQTQPESKNMALVGYNDLQGRSAYQPTIHKQGERWIAYIGHHGGSALNPLTGKVEDNGTSILDVTDPRDPKYLAHIPGEPRTPGPGESGGAQMTRVCDGSQLPRADKSKVYLLRTMGSSAQEIWDVTDPAKPARVTVIESGLHDSHKNFWECDTGIAFLVSGKPGWRTRRMMQVYDLSDPAEPIFIRDFGLPGQQPGATGPVPSDLHGAISTGPKGNRVYAAYGTTRNGVIEILDRDKLIHGPKEPTAANLDYPVISRLDAPPDVGIHTTFPMLGVDVHDLDKFGKSATRDFLVTVGETTDNGCQAPQQMMHIFDITTETRIFGVSTWFVPEPSGDFCSRGGRFGSHSINENMTPVYYKRVMFMTAFNAGVRAIDVRDPYRPTEIGYYIPAITDKTDKRCVGAGANEVCKIAIQTNNVEVDDRGYIYIVDRANTGMHILQLTGEARNVANLP